MGIFTRQYEREGAGLPMPEGGAARYFLILASNFWKLVAVNVLFLLFSLPAVTLPAALCAMNRVCIQIYRNGHSYIWQDFKEEFTASFKRSLLSTLLFAFLLFLGYYAMSLGLTNASLMLWSTLFWTIGIVLAVSGLCWGAYYFVLSAMLDQNNKGLLKNARLLCMMKPGRAMLVLAISVLVAWGMAMLMPISVLLIVFCVPALSQYTVCFLVYELAEEYIVEPYNNKLFE